MLLYVELTTVPQEARFILILQMRKPRPRNGVFWPRSLRGSKSCALRVQPHAAIPTCPRMPPGVAVWSRSPCSWPDTTTVSGRPRSTVLRVSLGLTVPGGAAAHTEACRRREGPCSKRAGCKWRTVGRGKQMGFAVGFTSTRASVPDIYLSLSLLRSPRRPLTAMPPHAPAPLQSQTSSWSAHATLACLRTGGQGLGQRWAPSSSEHGLATS